MVLSIFRSLVPSSRDCMKITAECLYRPIIAYYHLILSHEPSNVNSFLPPLLFVFEHDASKHICTYIHATCTQLWSISKSLTCVNHNFSEIFLLSYKFATQRVEDLDTQRINIQSISIALFIKLYVSNSTFYNRKPNLRDKEEERQNYN
jgi:hypothetical protein